MKGNANVRRGAAWEDLIPRLLDGIRDCSVVRTSPPFHVLRVKEGPQGRRFEGFFQRRGACDFVGHYRGVHVELEAKRHASGSGPWNFRSAIADHQWQTLAHLDAAGGMAGVLLLMDEGLHAFAIRFEAIEFANSDGRASFTLAKLLDLAKTPVETGIFDLRQGGALQPGGLRPFLQSLFDGRMEGDLL